MVDTIPVERAFDKMGANVIVREDKPQRFRRQLIRPTIDVREVEGKETFILDVPEDLSDRVSISVIDNQPKIRHLLLLVRTEGEIKGQAEVEKYLCGHDERHWFVSAVNGKNVMDALTNLKPASVQSIEKRVGVKRARKNKHHNEAWTRQGEWFFIPAPDFDPHAEKTTYCRNEPITRGRGSKPHMCEELARRGGQVVYVDGSHPNGMTESEYQAFMKTIPEERKRFLNFRTMVADAEVYVRGKIRHPDHKTVDLKIWHRVQLNGEIVSSAVRFLD